MERTFKLILPATDNSGDPIKTELLEAAATEIAQHFGGVTVYPVAAGCYVMEQTKELQCDQTIVLEATRMDATSGQIQEDANWLEQVAGNLGREFGQEAMFDQEERDQYTQFVPGQYFQSLPNEDIEPGASRRDPGDVFRDLLPR